MVAEAKRGIGPLRRDGRFVAGSAIAGALPVLVAPVLTRVYSADALASYSAYSTLLLVVGSMATARMETLIPGARRRAWARSLAQLALTGSLLVSLVTAATLWLMPVDLEFGSYDVALLRLALPLGVILFGCDAVFAGLLLRRGDTEILASTRIVQNTVRPIVQVGGALTFPAGSLLLAAGSLAGQSVALTQLWLRSAVMQSGITRGWSLAGLAGQLRTRRQFIGVAVPSAVVNAIAVNVQLLALAAVLPREAYGHMAVTAGLAGVPVTLLVPAFRQLVMRDLGMAVRVRGSVREAVGAAGRRAAPLVILVAVGGALIGPLALPFLLGQAWSDTAKYVVPLSLSAAIQLFVAPMASIFPMFQQMGLQLRLDLFRVGIVVAWTVAAAVTDAPPLVMVWGSAMLVAGTYAWTWLLINRLARNHDVMT